MYRPIMSLPSPRKPTPKHPKNQFFYLQSGTFFKIQMEIILMILAC